ncbi:MAG: hypothetical protein ACR2PL_04675, partial [Dehalococcoidia bacterium]
YWAVEDEELGALIAQGHKSLTVLKDLEAQLQAAIARLLFQIGSDPSNDAAHVGERLRALLPDEPALAHDGGMRMRQSHERKRGMIDAFAAELAAGMTEATRIGGERARRAYLLALADAIAEKAKGVRP